MGRRYIADFPFVGHYDTWKLDDLQKLIQSNHGLVFLPGHKCASDYKDTAETFQTVAIHTKELQDALEKVQISAEVKDKFSRDIKFLCGAQGVQVPFLPVSIGQEYILFTMLIRQMHGFDADSMAILWMEYVNGVTISPKLPVYLQEYYKHWQRNQPIQDAIKNMKSEKDFLDELNKRHVPAELLVATTTTTAEFPTNVAFTALQVWI
jgi:hypothetical protein